MNYWWNWKEDPVPWCWQEMVGQMNTASQEKLFTYQVDEGVAEEADHRSGGAACAEKSPRRMGDHKLMMCQVMQSDIYDHKFTTALGSKNKKGEIVRTWDFVLYRDDGIQFWMHPEWTKTRFQCKVGMKPRDHTVPKAGPGGSDGPGTYKHFTQKDVDFYLQFDAAKKRIIWASQPDSP